MQIDMTTQEIWHFIGSFQQVIEAARGRAAYDAFRAQQIEAANAELKFQDSTMKAPHKLADFTPGVPLAWQDAEPLFESFGTASFPVSVDGPLGPVSSSPVLPLEFSFAPAGFADDAQPNVPVNYSLPAPSVALVFAQLNRLSDQDVQIQDDLGVSFTRFSALDAAFNGVIETAHSLDPFGKYSHPADAAAIKTMAWEVSEDITLVTGGDHATALHGEAAHGVFVNGLAATELPKLDSHLPDLPEPVAVKPGSDLADQIAANAEAESAHIAITGGNSLVNQVTLTVSWLDAPVMLVMGDALSLNVISQINVLSEFTTTNGGVTAASQMFNIAQLAITSREVPQVPDADPDTFPTSWLVTTLNADVVNLNWMDQSNYLIDHDILSLTWSGASSFLRMGDNSLINIGSILELGLGYDLVVIGGDMINLSMIRQMNVLLDADWVASGGGSAQISAGGNLLWNGASIIGSGIDSAGPMSAAAAAFAAAAMQGESGAIPHAWANPAFAGIGTLKVLYITGDYLTMTMISQTNILGDADQVAALAARPGHAAGAEVSIHTGSNALVNLATINTGGYDSEIQVSGAIYSDALLYQASLIDDDASDPYAANGPTALASEAVLFLADGMLTADETPSGPSGDMNLNYGHLDGVNAVLA